jgi:hypothetical protein
MPEALKLMILFKISNQKGAPSDTENADNKTPAILTSQKKRLSDLSNSIGSDSKPIGSLLSVISSFIFFIL